MGVPHSPTPTPRPAGTRPCLPSRAWPTHPRPSASRSQGCTKAGSQEVLLLPSSPAPFLPASPSLPAFLPISTPLLDACPLGYLIDIVPQQGSH